MVPGDQDGGPHQIIQPGASWAPEFTVSQPAATLWFQLSDGSDLIQIASDGGLLSEPIPLKSIALSPGERAEVVIDFSAISDESIQLHSGGRPILDLHIKKPSQKRQPPLPEQLATIDPFPTDPDQTTRVFELQSMGITGTINGKSLPYSRARRKRHDGASQSGVNWQSKIRESERKIIGDQDQSAYFCVIDSINLLLFILCGIHWMPKKLMTGVL